MARRYPSSRAPLTAYSSLPVMKPMRTWPRPSKWSVAKAAALASSIDTANPSPSAIEAIRAKGRPSWLSRPVMAGFSEWGGVRMTPSGCRAAMAPRTAASTWSEWVSTSSKIIR